MKKIKENIKDFTPVKFAEWLARGIEDINSQDDKRRMIAFYPLNLIWVGDNLYDDLRYIYYSLPEQENFRKNFRKGIVINLYRYPKKISREIATALLHLAAGISCKEILPVINNWIDQGLDMKDKEFYALVLSVVAGLSPANGVADTLRKLVGVKKLFHYKYAPIVLVALCCAEPKSFIDHLKLLRKYFKVLHKKEGDNMAYMTARRIVCYIHPEVIAKNLWQTDKWLVKAFLDGKKAPLTLTLKR